MEKYVSVRIQAKQKKDAIGEFLHDTRKKIPRYINGPPDWKYIINIKEKFENILNNIRDRYNGNNKRKMQKNGRYSIAGILTFSEYVKNEDIKFFDEYAKQAIERIAQELNTDILYITKHMDEYKQHYHFQLSYIDKEGKPLRNKLTKAMMSKFQDIAGEVFLKVGLKRGKKKKERIQEAKNLGVKPNIWNKSVAKLHTTWADNILDNELKEIRKRYIEHNFLSERVNISEYIKSLEEIYKTTTKANIVLKQKISELVEKLAIERIKNKKKDLLEKKIKDLEKKINSPNWLKIQLNKLLNRQKDNVLKYYEEKNINKELIQ